MEDESKPAIAPRFGSEGAQIYDRRIRGALLFGGWIARRSVDT